MIHRPGEAKKVVQKKKDGGGKWKEGKLNPQLFGKRVGRFIFGDCCQNTNWKYWTQYFAKKLWEHFAAVGQAGQEQHQMWFFRK